MSVSLKNIANRLQEDFGDSIKNTEEHFGELTVEIKAGDLLKVCQTLRDNEYYACEQLIDVCGVDYLLYGLDDSSEVPEAPEAKRFAVVYHLLSIKHNRRLRLRVFLDTELPVVNSVVDIWSSANWFEREAFDLFGIIFEGHPDLRRILTDYGFVGYPFRKDFPISGHVETRYDPEKKRVVYEPVSIEPRNLTPRIIREDGFGG
jgi:NADH-quinone oxidoreductase subunit C